MSESTESPLHRASRMGYTETVRNILYNSLYSLSNQVDETGTTPLMLASLCGHTAIVLLLLQMGGDVHHTDNYGWTPLLLASYKGHTAIVRILLEYGANVHHIDNSGMTALQRATSWGYADIVRLLLENGAGAGAGAGTGAGAGAGAGVHHTNGEGDPPLQLASSVENAETVHALQENSG